VDAPIVHAPVTIRAGTPAKSFGGTGAAAISACAEAWAYASLWQKQAGTYVKIQETSRAGIPAGYCVILTSLRIASPGDYRIVAAAAYQGSYARAWLDRSP
jgi:hypothetical protein